MTEPTVPSEKSHSARAAYEPAASRSSHDPSDISHIAKRLREAQHPLILAGLGALESNAAAPIAEIVAVSGAPLATTLPAKDMFGSAEIPELAALFGGFGTPELKRYMEEMCDLLVVFGASLNRFTTEDGLLTRNCQIVQVDRDPDALGKETPIDFGVVGDARAVAADLVRAIQDWGRTRKRQEIRWIDPEYEDLSTPGGLDPRTLMRELDAWLPDSARVVCDGGHFIEWPARYLRPRSPGGFWLSIAGGSIGLSLPISIGMALAGDDRPAIAMMGDGSFFMGVAELETAKRTRAQLCAIVLNDKAYSAEVHRLRAMGMSPALAEFPDSPSVADVAASFGVSSRTIGSLTELRQFVREPFPDEPFVLEARITTKVWATRWRREEVRN